MNFEEVVKLAFVDELEQISRAGRLTPNLEKLGADQRLNELIKEALFLRALGKMIPRGGTAKFLGAAKAEGLGNVAMGALKKARPSARLQQWGQTMRHTPFQRVRAAAKAATNPMEKAMLKMRPGDARSLTRATQDIGGTSVGKRFLGAAAEGAGAHTGHAGILKRVGAHAGVPTAGAIEGLFTQAGRELKSVGTGMRARAAGQMTGGATARRVAGKALTGAGVGSMRAAPILGEGLEAGAALATGAPVLTSIAGGAVPGVALAAGKAGKAGIIGKKMIGSKVLGAADKGIVAARKRGLGPVLRSSPLGRAFGGGLQPAVA